MTKLGFILETFNRLLYIIEALTELVGKTEKVTHDMEKLGLVFCVQNKPRL